MGYTTKASDWMVSGVCQAGAAIGLGAGIYMFQFQSRDAGEYNGFFTFTGLGLGGGGSIGGANLPDATGGYSWSKLNCEQPFSAADLNNALGQLETIGGGFAAGYWVVLIN